MIRKILLLACFAVSTVWGQQVLLRVRFAQVDANAERLLAPSLAATSNSDIRVLDGSVDLVSRLEDLRSRGAGVRMLAEPALLASDAKPATLLIGDNVPTAVMHGTGVSLIYRDVGVQLTLQPTINPDGVRLSVKPSVSTLENTSLITVPAIGSRTSEANLQLSQGQSLVIDGLFDEVTKALLRNLPSQSPILDAILKNGLQPATKLLVIVTPEVL